MLITTTENTGGQKKMPENRTSCVKFKPYTIKPMVLPDIAGCGFIWRAMASNFLHHLLKKIIALLKENAGSDDIIAVK